MFDPKLTMASAVWIFGAMLLLWLLSLKLRDSSIVDIFWGASRWDGGRAGKSTRAAPARSFLGLPRSSDCSPGIL